MAVRGGSSSCESKRTSAYSEDLRWRIVWQREVEKLSLKNIASNLSVDASTVYRIVNTFQTTGTVMKKLYSCENLPIKMTRPVQLTVLMLVLDKPGTSLSR